jgi:hypothetical protein
MMEEYGMLIESPLAEPAGLAIRVGDGEGTSFGPARGAGAGLPAAGRASFLGTAGTGRDAAAAADGFEDRAGTGAGSGFRLKIFAMAPNMFGRDQSKPRARTGTTSKSISKNISSAQFADWELGCTALSTKCLEKRNLRNCSRFR